jgi:flagellar biosynthesis protein FliQ
MKRDVFNCEDLSLSLVVGITRAGVSSIILSKRWQLDEMSLRYVPRLGPVAIALLTIIMAPPILQPALATATNLPPPTNTTTYDDNNN